MVVLFWDMKVLTTTDTLGQGTSCFNFNNQNHTAAMEHSLVHLALVELLSLHSASMLISILISPVNLILDIALKVSL